MNATDLLAIGTYLMQQVHRFVPYTSNQHSRKYQPFHRTFWLDVMRARSSENKKMLRKWCMDLSMEYPPSGFSEKRVTQTFQGVPNPPKYPTLWQWGELMEKEPQREDKNHHKNGSKVSPLTNIENSAKNAVIFGVGNCGEQTKVATTLAVEYPREGLPNLPPIPPNENVRMDIVVARGVHMFLVLGMDPAGDLNDLSTWGDEAVIVDPWAKETFHVKAALTGKTTVNSLNFFLNHAANKNLEKYYPYPLYLGQGHSNRWLNHREAKNEPRNLRDWPTPNTKQNIPFLEERQSQKKTHQKKWRRT